MDNPAYLKQAQNMARKRGVGRNDECGCGSGQKFKRCCLPRLAKALAWDDGDRTPPDKLEVPTPGQVLAAAQQEGSQ